MCEYFWFYETELPPGVGIETFSAFHLAWVTTALAIIVLTILLYRRRVEAIRRRIQMSVVFIMVTIQLFSWLWTAISGHYTIQQMLPLHLCTLSVWIEASAVINGSTLMKEFSYCCGMPGAVFAMLTPVMGEYPFCNYFYMQFSLAHSILILLPLLWIFGDGFQPNIRRLPHCFGLLLVFAGIAALTNKLIGSNYMFLRYAPLNTLLEVFERWCGTPGYIIPLILMVFVVWIILYIPWVVYESMQGKTGKEISL